MLKGILFDKDGTLIDFSLWKDAAIKVIQEIIIENNIKDDKNKLFNSLKSSIGIMESGIDPFGALAYKSHEDLANELHFTLSKNNIHLDPYAFNDHIIKLLRDEVLRKDINFKEITDLKLLFRKLKNLDIKIGIATSDSYQSTLHFINKLDLGYYIDFIGSNDGIFKLKPHSDICTAFCNKFGIGSNEIAVIGDSYNDMLFARNCDLTAIGVLSGVSGKINLKDIADIILPSIECLMDENILLSLDKYEIKSIKLCTA